ncbi:hypothetical protein INR49_027798 [Caranx melampygus]|nr:hypothetical protein INR49_027798 [Caranx melampygus]
MVIPKRKSGEQLTHEDSCSEDDEHEQHSEATTYHQLLDRQSCVLLTVINEQNGLSVNEDGPTGETGQEQNQNSLLEYHPNMLQVTTPIALQILALSPQFKGVKFFFMSEYEYASR